MLLKLMKASLIIFTLQSTLLAKEINIDKFLIDAKASQKHLFIWLHKTNCGYCESMKNFTLENEKVKAFIDKNFLFVSINVSQKDIIIYKNSIENGRSFAKKMGYDFYPTSLFFDKEEDVAYVEVGYLDNEVISNQERFFSILKFVNLEKYTTMDFSEYEFSLKEEF